MTDNKKKRLSMLDAMASAGAPVAPSMMSNNRALRSARDAVDSHRIWDLDPLLIDDSRFQDRLDPSDIADLRASIEANGQTVPILVRRNTQDPERYALVYGRRRLEAIRSSEKVSRVRALIATMDEQDAIRAQVSENTARRDLSYIERALFARELLENGFGNQSQIAEVLNSTKSAISMALTVAQGIGPALARAIGPAHAVGRPRWEALARDITANDLARDELSLIAHTAYAEAQLVEGEADQDPSSLAFQAVSRAVARKLPRPAPLSGKEKTPGTALSLEGRPAGQIARTTKGIRLDLQSKDNGFLSWFETSAQDIVAELHARWKNRA